MTTFEEIVKRNHKNNVQYQNSLKLVNIDELIPTQKRVREETLQYYTFWYRNFGSLNDVDMRPPHIFVTDDNKLYLREGHHRATWYLINGIYQIAALITPFEENTEFQNRHCILDALAAQRNGIRSVQDFLKALHNPSKYKIAEGEK